MREGKRRKGWLVAALLFAAGLAMAHAQLVRSLEPLELVSTKAFDIYAPEALWQQALRLSDFADDTYATLLDFFGLSPMKRRIPVLLTDYQTSLNGFSTLYPSNRIVIFLASADPRSQLATLEDELRSVFLHELVHYVTLNEKTNFWSAASWLGGDWIAPEVWMMPQAIVEGTAVWAESRLEYQSDGSPQASGGGVEGGGVGRLNDPAALDYVRLDRVRNVARNLWDVSGLRDFYGSGSLPYLYGGLFIEYLSTRFGPEIISKVWRASAGGNIVRGFDGTLTSDGILERETGESAELLWKEFLTWIDAGIAQSADDGSVELFEGYVGTMGAGGGDIYFVDLERRGVYALSVEDGRGGAKGRERIFDADGTLRNIFFNVKFRGLDIDWIRTTSDNREIPARYSYKFDTRALHYERDLPIPKPGEALASAATNPDSTFFLYDSWRDPETDTIYGLGRCGPAVLPARKLPNGQVEIADIGTAALRWMSPGYRNPDVNRRDSIQFALQLIPQEGLSRLAILEETGGSWQLRVGKIAPPWGVSEPSFLDDRRVVYRGSGTDGRSTVRLLDIASFDATERAISWIPLAKWLGHHPSDSPDALNPAEPPPKSIHFPLSFAASRFPYADSSRVGIGVVASDITERLSWSLVEAWDLSTGRPATALSLRLATSSLQFGLSVADQAIPTLPVARRSSLGASLSWQRTLVPTYRNISANLYAACAGVRSVYPLSDVFALSPEYGAYSAGLSVGYASLFSSRDPPFSDRGFAGSARAEYELSDGGGFGGLSLSGSVSLKGFLSASLYGSFAPLGGVAFSSGLRFLENAGNSRISSADLPYPEYAEYRDCLTPSNWYAFGEAQARLFNIEVGSVLRLPFLPSLGIRRINGMVGVRAAGLEFSGVPGLLSSVFARTAVDTAILAGLGGATHTRFTLEAAWAFQPVYAGGNPLHISVGAQTSLE